MRRYTPFRWLVALTLAIALLPGVASAQEDGTLRISSTFYMDWLSGTVGDDLAGVFARGQEHAWTLTLHGTTQSHQTYSAFGVTSRVTEIHATSFDFEFFGPDAATLNSIVSNHIAGGDVQIGLRNAYSASGEFTTMGIWLWGPDVEFWTGHEDSGSFTPFPSDADGYPVVGPDPFSMWTEGSSLIDNRPGNNGRIDSWDSVVTFEGSVGESDPGAPVVLAVTDASVLEGGRGSSRLDVTVALSQSSTQVVTVQYATANQTAVAPQDYTATGGTLTFEPGQTSRTISIAINGDRKREANETFSVQLSNAVGATVADGVATVTVLNDD